jgi:hypothetical protein
VAVLRRAPAALLAVLLLAAPAGAARSPEEDLEYGVKAAFLYNFAKFVDWPAGAFPDARSPFNLCVLGDDPFGPLLDRTVADDSIDGRPIAVRRGARLAELRGCHVLFVSRSERERRREVLAALHNAAVLTVGDADGFLADGGMIDFVLESNRVRFEVNLAAVEKSPLKMSSKLLRLARVVRSEPGGGGSR